MSYYIILYHDRSLKIFKSRQKRTDVPQDARQFECSSNVTVQDLHVWAHNGFKDIPSIRELGE